MKEPVNPQALDQLGNNMPTTARITEEKQTLDVSKNEAAKLTPVSTDDDESLQESLQDFDSHEEDIQKMEESPKRAFDSSENALDSFLPANEDSWLSEGAYKSGTSVKTERSQLSGLHQLVNAATAYHEAMLKEEKEVEETVSSKEVPEVQHEESDKRIDESHNEVVLTDLTPIAVPDISLSPSANLPGRGSKSSRPETPMPASLKFPRKFQRGPKPEEKGNELNVGKTYKIFNKDTKPYSLLDHAEYLGLKYTEEDLGYPTCPMLTSKDAAHLLEEKFDPIDEQLPYHMNNGNNEGKESSEIVLDDDEESENRSQATAYLTSKNFAIKEIIECTREYVRPMSTEALSRIYSGLNEAVHVHVPMTGALQNTPTSQQASSRRLLHRKSSSMSLGNLSMNLRNSFTMRNNTTKFPRQESFEKDSKCDITIQNFDGSYVGGSEDFEHLPVRTVAIRIRPDVAADSVMDAINTSMTLLEAKVTLKSEGHLRALVPGHWIHDDDFMPFRPPIEKRPSTPDSCASPPPQRMRLAPPIVIDSQLVTRKKSKELERILLVRSFAIEEGQILDRGQAVCPTTATMLGNPESAEAEWREILHPNSILLESAALFQRTKTVATEGGRISFGKKDLSGEAVDIHPESASPGNLGRFSSLRQLLSPSSSKTKIESPVSPKHANIRFEDADDDTVEKTFVAKKDPKESVRDSLLTSFEEGKSVTEHEEGYENAIPALSSIDWMYIQSTWRFLSDCLKELEDKNLSYATLTNSKIGEASSSLSTLDGHYCEQIRHICKNEMVNSLWRSVDKMEEHARSAEDACVELKEILDPMADMYSDTLFELPEANPLSEYSLNYSDPRQTAPPYGPVVNKALEQIILENSNDPIMSKLPMNEKDRKILSFARTSSNLALVDKRIGFEQAKRAVEMVYKAFQEQFDEELKARLDRRNRFIFDRLQRVRAYTMSCIETIRGNYGISEIATKSAEKVNKYVLECAMADLNSNVDSRQSINVLPVQEQVPLLSCRAIVGGGLGAGMCYVTLHQLLVVTKSVPVLGGKKIFLFQLKDIAVTISEESKRGSARALLGIVPSSVVVSYASDGNEVCSFRPATGAELFKDFIDILKAYSMTTETFSE